ncbi:hypothetical protein VNO77_18385 [Canavalia gladiata]|uniref:Uncharacterized protein n=1 Tax=Canavalia gladiata TaxID=3824 RepID=A0AAN9LPC7_CANGL
MSNVLTVGEENKNIIAYGWSTREALGILSLFFISSGRKQEGIHPYITKDYLPSLGPPDKSQCLDLEMKRELFLSTLSCSERWNTQMLIFVDSLHSPTSLKHSLNSLNTSSLSLPQNSPYIYKSKSISHTLRR